MWIPKWLRVKRSLNHAKAMFGEPSINAECRAFDPEICPLPARSILRREGGLIVTEEGFVTMAISIADLIIEDAVRVAPGVDDRGQRGFLVMYETGLPFHSLKPSALEAIEDALANVKKAESLLQRCGGRANMRRMVSAAPWHLSSTYADFLESGLCLWGAESFLRRLGLLSLARRFGLPRFLLRLAGPYGARLTAAALLRKRSEAGSETSNTIPMDA